MPPLIVVRIQTVQYRENTSVGVWWVTDDVRVPGVG